MLFDQLFCFINHLKIDFQVLVDKYQPTGLFSSTPISNWLSIQFHFYLASKGLVKSLTTQYTWRFHTWRNHTWRFSFNNYLYSAYYVPGTMLVFLSSALSIIVVPLK